MKAGRPWGGVAAIAFGLLAGAPALAQSIDEMSLSAAARECRPAEIAQLIGKGVDVNAVNSGGYTPLMLAAGNGCLEGVRLLLEGGADAAIEHASFGTAASQAKMHGQGAAEALLAGAGPRTAVATEPAAPPARAPAGSAAPNPALAPAVQATRGAIQWPRAGAYSVGQRVLYSGSGGKTWAPAVIKSIDPTYGYNLADGPSGSYSHYFVVAPEREPFWTEYFVGDWRVSVPVATGLVTDGRYVYRTVSGGMRLPPLRINADGTYSWRVQEGARERLIQGRWEPNPAGPGVILKNAEQGADWLVYNNTDALSTLGETIILSSDCCTHYDGRRLSGE